MGAYLAGLQGVDLIERIAIVLIILGTAAVFGGFFHQLQEKSKDVTNGMFVGAIVQFVAAALVVVIGLTDDRHFSNQAWVYLLVIPLVIAVLAVVFRKKRNNQMVWAALGVLSGLALVLGLFW